MAGRKTIIRKFLNSVAIPTLFGTLIVLLSLSTCKEFEPEGFLFITTDTTQALGEGNYKLSGSVVEIGSDEISQHGFCWSEQRNPNTTGLSTQLGSRTTTGDFSSTISDLSPTTTYFYRAYVITTAGTEYAVEKSFITDATIPTVITTAIGNTSDTSAVVGGNVTSDGGAAVTERGIYYGTFSDPKDTGTKVAVGSGTGDFSTTLTGLTNGTEYFYVAYATNSAGTAFGTTLSFTTNLTEVIPTVTTSAASAVGETSATVGGEVTDDGGATVTERGIYYGTSTNPQTTGTKVTYGSGSGTFSGTLTELTNGTEYYFVAYATNSAGTAYGSTLSFTTVQTEGVPAVETSEATSVDETSATVGGEVTNDGGATVTDRGVYYSTSSNPQTTGTKMDIGSGIGTFSDTLTELTNGTEYYFVAYATNNAGTAYGSTLSFTTVQTEGVPAVTTSAASLVEETTATVGGEITDDGGGTVTERGVYYGTSSNPQTSGTKKSIGSGSGIFSTNLTGLLDGITYYFVAYATNGAGTSFGTTESFTTKEIIVEPAVTTSEATLVEETTATVGGNVTDDGGGTVTERGIYYGTSSDPQITGTKKSIGSGTGIFSDNLTGLLDGITYYFVAYATNSAGTSFGTTESFTTKEIIVEPTVTTSSATSVGETTATVGGNVTDDGGGTVTERGIYYGTSSDPQTTGTKKMVDSGSGIFSTTLTDLMDGVTYYYVAYAINSAGTSYGTTLDFTTPLITSVTDFDGNVYPVVVIGDQMWIAENLKSTQYSDGELLLFIEDEPNWDITAPSDRAYSWYDYDESNKNTYGALYSWAAAMKSENGSDLNPSGIQGVCPVGWHIPSDAEWKEMEIFLEMNPGEADGINWRGTNQGGKLKSMDPLWVAPNLEASNESGFSALPGGYIQQNGMSVHLGYWAVFWTATQYSGGEAWHRNLLNNYAQVYRYFYDMRGGFSVRCIRD